MNKNISFLLIVFLLLLSGCSHSQESSIPNEESIPSNFDIPSPSPTIMPLSTYDDGIVMCQYDDSLLQVSSFSNPDSEVSYGWVSSIKGSDLQPSIIDESSLYITTIKFDNMDFYNQYPSAATQALFDGLFHIQPDSTSSVSKLANGNYVYSLFQSGYNCKGEILAFDNDFLTILVYRLDENLSPEIAQAFNSCYDSINFKSPNFTNENDDSELANSITAICPNATLISNDQNDCLSISIYLTHENYLDDTINFFTAIRSICDSCKLEDYSSSVNFTMFVDNSYITLLSLLDYSSPTSFTSVEPFAIATEYKEPFSSVYAIAFSSNDVMKNFDRNLNEIKENYSK